MRQFKTQYSAWLEKFNPLSGMSIQDLQNVFDAARGGDTQRLHWIFQEIEAVNPTLSVCVDRRASAMANFQWRIAEKATADSSLAAEQKDAAERFFGDIENLHELFEHLDLAFFRGFAHAQPIWEADGTVRHISPIDSWRFVRKDGAWLYNPKCTGFTSDCIDCANARLVTVVRRRPIDYPALGVHVRDAVGNRDWGRFLERHALPKPAVTMHPGATEENRADYLAAAVAVENGQVSVWPNGASLTDFAGGSRGTDPFRSFIEHQEETIVRLATGGTLGSIAQAGSGTLAGGAQQDVWESIVARDSAVIASAIERALLRPFLDFAFPGKAAAVGFGFDFTKPPTPKEVFDTAASARAAGWIIDHEELEEQTGYTLTPAPEAAQNTPQNPFSDPKTPSLTLRNAKTAFKTTNNAFKTARKDLDAQGAASAENGSEGVLEAFCKDGSKAAQEVLKLLEDPTAEKATELIEKLPSLLPEDPALAAVIAEEMAKEFKVKVEGEGVLLNSECRAKNPAACRTHGMPRELKTKGLSDRFGRTATEQLAANPEQNAERGKNAIAEVLRKKSGHVDKGMFRPETGWIRLEWGDAGDPSRSFKGGHGLSHIEAKHPEALKKLPSVLAEGTIYKHEEPGKMYILKGNAFAVVGSVTKGGKTVITEFNSGNDPKKVAAIKKLPLAKTPGEN